MDLRYSSDEEAFRAGFRAFLRDVMPPDIPRRVRAGQPLRKDDFVRAQRALNAGGWAVPHWPAEWGGRSWSPVQCHIWLDELQCAAIPPPLSANVSMIGPVLAAFGSEEQKRRFLPRIANLDDWWCQGFSEPEAGSDLAALKTSARRRGDVFVVDGQKIWTTYAQHADWMFALVRTDFEAKPQRGISMLLIDMTSPGITRRPIHLIDRDHEVNEVFFDRVEVPVANLVGEENMGWSYAKFLLANERTGIAGVGVAKEMIARARQFAQASAGPSDTRWDERDFRMRVAEIEAELAALEVTQLRVAASQRRDPMLEAAASLLKIKGSELQQAVSELLLEVAGTAALEAPQDDHGDWRSFAPATYFNWRKLSIYGGSNEIQRNIVARTLLDM